MASYERRGQTEAHDANRARQAAAQRLLEEAGFIPQPTVRHNPLLDLPENLWLRVFSYLDVKTLLDSCALVCHAWLGYVYQMTGKQLSFTGYLYCEQCHEQRVLREETMRSMMRYLAKRAGSLESIGLDFRIIEKKYFNKIGHILGACGKLTSVTILAEKYRFGMARLWDILPKGLTSVKISDENIYRTQDLPLRTQDLPLRMDKLRELHITGSASLRTCDTSISDKIFHKLETLTLCHIDYKELPPPEVLKSLTRLSIPATAKSFFKGATSELVDFVMGLNKLTTLSITRARQCGERDCQVGMCKLQGHVALGEICLDFYKEEDARLPWYGEEDMLNRPLTESLCSFFAMPQLKVLSLIIGIPQAEEPFGGVKLSASGLRQVALKYATEVPNLKISELISAPNLEHLELEFPSISNIIELPLRIAGGKQHKPFRLTLVSSGCVRHSPRTLSLDWNALEKGFGPQDCTNWRRTGFELHQPLVRRSNWKHRRIYCNQAYTAAARARTPRLAASPQTCEFELFPEDWLCEKCEEKDQEIGRGTW